MQRAGPGSRLASGSRRRPAAPIVMLAAGCQQHAPAVVALLAAVAQQHRAAGRVCQQRVYVPHHHFLQAARQATGRRRACMWLMAGQSVAEREHRQASPPSSPGAAQPAGGRALPQASPPNQLATQHPATPPAQRTVFGSEGRSVSTTTRRRSQALADSAHCRPSRRTRFCRECSWERGTGPCDTPPPRLRRPEVGCRGA